MKKALIGVAVLAMAMSMMPANAATLYTTTKTIMAPVGGTYGYTVNNGTYAARCRDGITGGNTSKCTPSAAPGSPTSQYPVKGDDVVVERGGLGRAHRCVYQTDKPSAQDGTTGKVGYTLDLTAYKEKSFTLRAVTPTAGQPIPDFDVVFYADLGSCGSAGPLPRPEPADPIVFSNLGNESGKLPDYGFKPDGSKWPLYAIVLMFAGPPNQRFTFTVTG